MIWEIMSVSLLRGGAKRARCLGDRAFADTPVHQTPGRHPDGWVADTRVARGPSHRHFVLVSVVSTSRDTTLPAHTRR